MTLSLKQALIASIKKRVVLVWAALTIMFFGLVETASRIYWVMSDIEDGPCLNEARDKFGSYCMGERGEKTFLSYNSLWSDGIWNNGDWWQTHFMGFAIVILLAVAAIIVFGLYLLAEELVDKFQY